MKSIQLASNEYLLVFTHPDPEEDVIAAINTFAEEHHIASGRLQAVGSVQSAMLAWWNNTTNAVEKYPAEGQFEVVSFLGNLAMPAAKNCQRVHAHAVLAGPGGTLIGGHVVSMTVRASLEVSLTTFVVPVTRAFNKAFNLCTIELP